MQSLEENACLIHLSSFHTNFFRSLRNKLSFFIRSSVRPSVRACVRMGVSACVRPSDFPSFLPSCLQPFLPSSLPSFLPFFLSSFLPCFSFIKIVKKILKVFTSALDLDNFTAVSFVLLKPDFPTYREPKRPSPHIQVTDRCKVQKPRKVLITGKKSHLKRK